MSAPRRGIGSRCRRRQRHEPGVAVDGIVPDQPLLAMARRILAVRIAEVYSYRPIIHRPEAVEATHALRISLKRLRYTLELFESVFGETGATQIERVKQLQETLGSLHDLDVRLDLIGRFRVGHDDDDHQDDARDAALARYARREREQRDALHATFVEQWNAYQQAGMRSDLVSLSQARRTRNDT